MCKSAASWRLPSRRRERARTGHGATPVASQAIETAGRFFSPRFRVSRCRLLGVALASAGFLLVVSIPFALAQWRTAQDAEICVFGTGVRSLDIAVCGRALRRNDLSHLDRSSVLTARGRAYRDSGRSAAALADLDAALALNPHSANALHERALTFAELDRYERALQDFARSVALSPRFAAAYKSRGVVHFFAGDLHCAGVDLDVAARLERYDAEIHVFRGFVRFLAGRYRDAGEDFNRAAELGLAYSYLPLWIYLSDTSADERGTRVLVEVRERLLPGEWPRLLLDVYLGELAPEALIGALESADGSPANRRRLAESHYYLGAMARHDHRPERARAHLERALTLADRGLPERALATFELASTADRTSTARPRDC